MSRVSGHLTGFLMVVAFVAGLTPALAVMPMHKSPDPVKGNASLVSLNQGLLSVRVSNMAASDLLVTIARAGGFSIRQHGELAQRVSLDFHRLPLWQGLQRILGGRSFALQYARPADAVRQQTNANPKALWIFGKDPEFARNSRAVESSGAVPESGDDVVIDIASLQEALESSRVQEREAAIAWLGDTELAVAVGPLSMALVDDDASVREMAAEELAELGGPDAIAALALALGDRDPAVREEAVDALGSIGGVQAIGLLEQALSDEEEFVRDAAAEWLEELHPGSRF